MMKYILNYRLPIPENNIMSNFVNIRFLKTVWVSKDLSRDGIPEVIGMNSFANIVIIETTVQQLEIISSPVQFY